MNSLTLTLIRVAFLAVLWLFVIAAIGVVRTDLFGTAAAKVRKGRNRGPQRQPQRPQKQQKPSRGTPRFLVVTEGGLSGMSIDLTDQDALNRVWGEYFRDAKPATTTVQVVRLAADPRCLVEINAIAVIDGANEPAFCVPS